MNSPFFTNAPQRQLFPDRPNGLFLVAVRRDGRRSHVETFAEFEPMLIAARCCLYDDEIAWVSLNHHIGRVPHQSHLVTRGHNGEVLIAEQAGRLERVKRGKERKSSLTAPA